MVQNTTKRYVWFKEFYVLWISNLLFDVKTKPTVKIRNSKLGIYKNTDAIL